MRCLVFSDIHGRAESLDLLPDDEGLINICLGDICAGDPEDARRAIDKLRERGALCVSGSHDRPVVDDEALEWFRSREELLRREGRGNPDMLRRLYDDALRIRRGLGGDHPLRHPRHGAHQGLQEAGHRHQADGADDRSGEGRGH